MAALSANKIHRTAQRGVRSFVINNGTAVYAGGLVGTNAAGYLAPWADTAGHKFEGLCLAGATGNTSATPPTETHVDQTGPVIKSATVASLTQADVNSLVYCASDNPADFSLAASTNVKAVGFVCRYISSGVGDVQLFTPAEHHGLN